MLKFFNKFTKAFAKLNLILLGLIAFNLILGVFLISMSGMTINDFIEITFLILHVLKGLIADFL